LVGEDDSGVDGTRLCRAGGWDRRLSSARHRSLGARVLCPCDKSPSPTADVGDPKKTRNSDSAKGRWSQQWGEAPSEPASSIAVRANLKFPLSARPPFG